MVSQPLSPKHSLVVYSKSGLCNRLDLLTSGLALAEATGRNFEMLWPRTPTCGAFFGELFANDWNVSLSQLTIEQANARAGMAYIIDWMPWIPDPLTDGRDVLFYGSALSLLQPDHFPEHAKLIARQIQIFDELEVLPSIQAEIDQFREAHFRSPMIGVHARRGDFLLARPDVVANTNAIFVEVDRLLATHPQAKIYLATDDGAVMPSGDNTVYEGLVGQFRARYGDRVAYRQPRTLDRKHPESIQDALVELWLLRSVDFFVGTSTSTFSQNAVFGRTIPYTLCGVPQPWYHRVEQIGTRLA